MKHTHIRIFQGKKVIQEFEIDTQSMAIKATPNTDIVLKSKTTNTAPEKVKVTRKGNDLLVTTDDGETMLTITEYYATDDVTILGVAEDGVASYHLNSSEMYTAISDLSSATHYLDVSQEAMVAISGVKPYLLTLAGAGILWLADHENKPSDSKTSSHTTGVTPLPTQPTTPTTPSQPTQTQPTTPTNPTTPTQPTQPAPATVEAIDAATAINEGENLVVTITLNNTNGNANVPFALAGVQSADYGTLRFDNGVTLSNGVLNVPQGVKTFTITLPISDDQTTEGAEQLTLTVGGQTKEITINDTSVTPTVTPPTPQPVINASVEKVEANPSVNEGERMVATVTLSDANGNPSVPFVLQGVQEADYDKTSMSFSNGVTQNADGTLNVPKDVKEFTITLPIVADKLTDANEKLTLVVGGQSREVVINDTSTTPAPTPQPTLLFSFAGETNVDEEVYGAKVATLSVQNGQAGDTYTYTVEDSRFEMVGDVLKLKNDVKLDYETEPTVSLKVTFTNQDNIARTTTYSLKVKDTNNDMVENEGSDQADELHGNDGKNDVLTGKKGNDKLFGGTGSDTYVFRKGDGVDTIVESDAGNTIILQDVNSAEVVVSQYQLKTTLTYGSGDSVTFVPSAIKSIKFADTTWDLTDGNVKSEKLGISYWHEALVHNAITGHMRIDNNQDGKISFAFPATPVEFEFTDGATDADKAYNETISRFTPKQQEITKSILAKVSEFLPIEFTEAVATEATPKDDTIYLQNSHSLLTDASGTMVGGISGVIKQGGGAVWINGNRTDASADYNEELMWFLLTHELGHAFGLVHPTPHSDGEKTFKDGYVLNAKEDSFALTIMTSIARHQPANIPTEYGDFDISALQYLYGVNPNARTGDDAYLFDGTKGVFVWDGAGEHDYIDASSATVNAYINLNAGTHSYLGQKSAYISDANQLTINHGTIIEGAIGGQGDDVLIGNHEDNELSGGAGDDILTGGLGKDFFVYDYTSSKESNNPAGNNGRDTITDFAVGNAMNDVNADFISLTDLLVGYNNDRFTLGNYLSIEQKDGNSILSIDRDGAGTNYDMTELVVLQGLSVELSTLLANGQII